MRLVAHQLAPLLAVTLRFQLKRMVNVAVLKDLQQWWSIICKTKDVDSRTLTQVQLKRIFSLLEKFKDGLVTEFWRSVGNQLEIPSNFNWIFAKYSTFTHLCWIYDSTYSCSIDECIGMDVEHKQDIGRSVVCYVFLLHVIHVFNERISTWKILYNFSGGNIYCGICW